MAPFRDLFNGEVTVRTVFGESFDVENVKELLLGIRDDPSKYGINNPDASRVAGAFIKQSTNPLDSELVDIIQDSPITSPRILDLGAALGYLFSTQAATSQEMEAGYRPVLHMYGRYLQALKYTVAMSAIMYDSSSQTFFYSSTITKKPGSTGNKTAVQSDRLKQLQEVLGAQNLPSLPPTVVRKLSKQLAGVVVPDAAGVSQRSVIPENILRLYDLWVWTLVSQSSQTNPLTVTITGDEGALNTARENIYNAESDTYRPGVTSGLANNQDWKGRLEGLLSKGLPQLYGHCAETLVFIYLIRNSDPRQQTQGLAMVPGSNKYLNDTGMGTAAYDVPKVFRRPCPNCSSLVPLAGMDPSTFNLYINTAVIQFDPQVS